MAIYLSSSVVNVFLPNYYYRIGKKYLGQELHLAIHLFLWIFLIEPTNKYFNLGGVFILSVREEATKCRKQKVQKTKSNKKQLKDSVNLNKNLNKNCL